MNKPEDEQPDFDALFTDMNRIIRDKMKDPRIARGMAMPREIVVLDAKGRPVRVELKKPRNGK